MLAEVTGIDPERRQVHARRPFGERMEFGYDYLIVAAGVQQSYFGHDEFARYAPGMKSIEDALVIRRRVFGAFEMAETATDPAERTRWLTFALVGAGPTGVELAGQIREVATKTLRREYRHISPEDARVLLFDGGDAPLASFGPVLSGKAAAALTKLGVEQHMHSIVTQVDGTGLLVRDQDGKVTRYEAGTVLWAAGVAAPGVATAIAKTTGAKCDRAGRIAVGKDLTIPGYPEIYVPGDLMSLDGLPGVAEVAMQGGLYAGRHIRHAVTDAPGQAVPLSRPRDCRLHLPRQRRGLRRQAALQRLYRLVGLAVRAHRLPHRLPQPGRRHTQLVVRLHPGPAPRTHVHRPRGWHSARRVQQRPAHQWATKRLRRIAALARQYIVLAADQAGERFAMQVPADVLGGHPGRRLEHARDDAGIVR